MEIMVVRNHLLGLSELCRDIEQGDETILKELANLILKDPQIRSKWVLQVQIWAVILSRIQEEIRTYNGDKQTGGTLQLALQLTNNLSANIMAGRMALTTRFLHKFINIDFPVEYRRLFSQILANISAGFNEEFCGPATILLKKAIHGCKMDIYGLNNEASDSTNLALLLFHTNILDAILPFTPGVRESMTLLWPSILDNLNSWTEDEENGHLLLQQCESLAWNLFLKDDLSHLFDIVQTRQQKLSLLTILVNLFERKHDEMNNPDIVTYSSNGQHYLRRICADIVSDWSTFIDCLNSNESNLVDGLLAQKWLVLLAYSWIHIPEPEQAQMKKLMLSPIIELLIASKNIRARSKLKDVNVPNRPDEFPFLKCQIIEVLTQMVVHDKDSQNLVRTEGGLNAVLECCIIDSLNPFLKEYAVVCLRFLLLDNPENQKFVESMEARQFADPQQLADAGYEAEIVNGKISIRKS